MKFELHTEERMLLLGIVLCALVVLFGYSFAYFTSGVTFGGGGSLVKGETATLTEVTYDAGDKGIKLENVVPGDKDQKNFSVTVKPGSNESEEVTYEVFLNITKNDFKKCSVGTDEGCKTEFQELTYKFSEGGGEAKTGDLTGANNLISLGKFTHTPQNDPFNYSFEITWNNADFDQKYNVGANFQATIEVKFADKGE